MLSTVVGGEMIVLHPIDPSGRFNPERHRRSLPAPILNVWTPRVKLCNANTGGSVVCPDSPKHN